MKNKQKLKPFPILKSDKQIEEFVSKSDLTNYDFKKFKPLKFEFENKSARLNMRLPENLLESIKRIAEEMDIPYSKFIRLILEERVAKELQRGI